MARSRLPLPRVNRSSKVRDSREVKERPPRLVKVDSSLPHRPRPPIKVGRSKEGGRPVGNSPNREGNPVSKIKRGGKEVAGSKPQAWHTF